MTRDRPANVPESATLTPEGLWVLSEESHGWKKRASYYDEDGFKLRSLYYEHGVLKSSEVYHPGGFARLIFDDWAGKEANTGTFYVKDRDKVSPVLGPGFPELPSVVVASVEFELENVDVDAFTYTICRPVYFDEGGAKLPASGKLKPPRKSAVLVKGGKTMLWRDGAVEGETREGRWTYFTVRGKKAFEEQYDNGKPTTIIAYGKKKAPVWEWEPGVRLRVPTKDGALELETGPDSRILRVHRGDSVQEAAVDLAAPMNTAEAFVAAYNEVFAPFAELDLVDVALGTATIVRAQVCRFDQVLKASVLLDTNGGDEVLVIEEPGAYQGRVYTNLHDEGLFALESLDEFVRDEGLEGITNKDELIARLPFAEDEGYESLGSAFSALEVVPRDDPRELLASLEVVED